jgi:hypothetical protein
MFTFGRNPFDGVEHKDLLEHMLRNQQKGFIEKPALCPDEMYVNAKIPIQIFNPNFYRYEIMQKCLTLDEEARPNFAQTQEELAAFLEKNSGDILNIVLYSI